MILFSYNWYYFGANLLLLIGLFYGIRGLIELVKLGKYEIFIGYVLAIISVPILFYYTLLVENDKVRMWMAFSLVGPICFWLFIGYMIRNDVEQLKKNEYIPIKQSGNQKVRLIGFSLIVFNVLLGLAYINNNFNVKLIEFLFIIAFMYSSIFGVYYILTGKKSDI